jgi:hypothetical protein
MAAFDAAQGSPSHRARRDYWYLAAVAAAAVVLIAAGIGPVVSGRRGNPSSVAADPQRTLPARDVRLEPPGEFVSVPGAAGLPPMESGTLVRMDLPVAELPSLGVTPPVGRAAATVTADLIVAQDGLPRAVRVVRTSTTP